MDCRNVQFNGYQVRPISVKRVHTVEIEGATKLAKMTAMLLHTAEKYEFSSVCVINVCAVVECM